MNNAYRYVLIVFLGLFVHCACAETQWYQVEIIVFAQNAKSNEAFDQTASRIEWPDSVMELDATPLPLAELKQYPQAYTPLQSADRSLTAAYQTLQLQGGYRPLLHTAWVQPLDADQLSSAVHIHAGGDAGEGEVLNGFVRLENGDPLDLLADLEYTPAGTESDSAVYRLRERRRLQLDETHYLDHPKFGIIGRVSLLQ